MGILLQLKAEQEQVTKSHPSLHTETLAETIESGPLCITDLFQNKSVAYFYS